jgi:hypothetical protein
MERTNAVNATRQAELLHATGDIIHIEGNHDEDAVFLKNVDARVRH